MNPFRSLYMLVRKYLLNIDDRSQLEIAVENGLRIGKDCSIMGEVILDPGHCWLIEIGDSVTLAPRVHILAHDASTKRELGYTRIAPVRIGSNVFVGAGTIILPGVTIGDKVIIGAGSVVTKDIPSNTVAVGNPCREIGSYDDYMERKRAEMACSRLFEEEYRIGNIKEEGKEEMRLALRNGRGYVR